MSSDRAVLHRVLRAATRVIVAAALPALIACAPVVGGWEPVDQDWERLNADTLNALKRGDYSGAERAARAALDRSTALHGERHRDTLVSLNNYAFTLRQLRRAGDAEPIQRKAVDLSTEILGESHRLTLVTLNNLALALESQGRAAEMEHLTRLTLERGIAVLGERDPVTLHSLNNYGGALLRIGRLGEAEAILRRSLTLCTEVLGENDRDTLAVMNNHAMALRALGRVSEAEAVARRALELSTITLGQRHPDTLLRLNNHALVLHDLGRLREAEPLFRQALALSTDVLGESHPDTLLSMSNLAVVLHGLGRAGESEALYRRSLTLSTRALGERHRDTLRGLNNLAVFLMTQGRTGESEAMFRKTHLLHADVLGERHPDTLTSLLNHIATLVRLGRVDEASRELRQGLSLLHGWTGQEMTSIGRDDIRRAQIECQASWLDLALTVALDHPSPDRNELAAESVLRWKQRVGEEDAYVQALARRSRDPEVRRLAGGILEETRRVAWFARQPERAADFQAAGARLDGLRRDLRRISQDFRQRSLAETVTAGEVAGRLPPGGVLVDFRVFRPVSRGVWGSQPLHLAALVLAPGRPPLLHDAGPIGPIGALVDAIEAGDPSAARTLHQRLFGPVESLLARASVVFLAPDGPLWRLSPAALRVPAEGGGERYWIERQPVVTLATGRELAEPVPARGNTGLLAVGGVDFAGPGGAAAVLADAAPGRVLRSAGVLPAAYAPLPVSVEEVGLLKGYFEAPPLREPVTLLTGANATEGALKSLAEPPRVLHLATHGDYRAADAPGARPETMAWVALAGANRGLRGESAEAEEDGLLTALEAATLNLDGTELVVLSACRTAQGRADYSEGLIGLVGAFRTAGAQRVLAALRNVPDGLTAEFMDRFYREWLQRPTDGPQDALRRTQRAFLASGDPARADPRFWGAFVMVGR